MTNFDIDEMVADRGGHCITEYLETIALLQEEIVRLEQELLSRTERPWESVSGGDATAEDEVIPSGASVSETAALAEVERLTRELANREETVALLFDQLGLLEESSAASRAEWEQLTGWVAELEQRVEGHDEDAVRRLQARLGDQQRETDELRTNSEQHLRGWEVQRQLRDERDELLRHLDQVKDERRREGLEHEAALAELRTRLSHASLLEPEASRPVQQTKEQIGELEPDLRIRALRQHLLEIHQRDEDVRRKRSLTTRLSRLWSRTSPQ